MKKPYSKPEIFAESFQMLEHIAACLTVEGFTAMHNTAWTCAIQVGTEIAFTNEVNACADGTSYDSEVMKDEDFMNELVIGSQCYTTTTSGPMYSS